MTKQQFKITDKKKEKIITVEELALTLYRMGERIIYCDIEGIATLDEDYYLLDECGNAVWINPKQFEVVKI